MSGTIDHAVNPWAPVAHEDAPATALAPQGERIPVRAHDRAPVEPKGMSTSHTPRRSNDRAEPVTPLLHVPLALPLTVPDKVLEQLAAVAESNRALAEQIEQQTAMMQQAAADASDAHLQLIGAIGGLSQVLMALAERLGGPARP